jgi:hypothetical protein
MAGGKTGQGGPLSQQIRHGLFAIVAAALALGGSAGASEPQGAPPPGEDDTGAHSLTEVNKALSNPVSELWSITFQQNNFRIDPGLGQGDRWSSNLLFQPVLPVALSPDWNLITRPVIPLFVSQPRPDPEPYDPFHVGRSTAFGDIVLLQLVSPSARLVGKWLLGAGPSWVFPTANSDFTGSGRYQVGPGVLAGYLSEKWILGVLLQNWWSFGGGARDDTASMNLQPIAAYFLRNGWSIGYSGNILANWKNSGGSDFTVPIGIGVSKVTRVGKLPLKIGLGLQWMAVQPDRFGQKWNVQLIVTPVLPKLIRGNLTDPSSLQFGLPH